MGFSRAASDFDDQSSAEACASVTHVLRVIICMAWNASPKPIAVIIDSLDFLSTPESAARAGYEGYKERKGYEMHATMDPWSIS